MMKKRNIVREMIVDRELHITLFEENAISCYDFTRGCLDDV